MKVVLFKKNNSLISRAISYVTDCDYTHAAIMINNYSIIDSSERRGYVDIKSFHSYKDRDCVIYDLKRTVNIDNALIASVGEKYDWKGVFGWLLRFNDKDKFYCFEYVMKYIRMCRKDEYYNEDSITGYDIEHQLLDYNAVRVYAGKLSNYKYK